MRFWDTSGIVPLLLEQEASRAVQKRPREASPQPEPVLRVGAHLLEGETGVVDHPDPTGKGFRSGADKVRRRGAEEEEPGRILLPIDENADQLEEVELENPQCE